MTSGDAGKPAGKCQRSFMFFKMYGISEKNGTEELACGAEIEKETWRTDPGGEADGGVH